MKLLRYTNQNIEIMSEIEYLELILYNHEKTHLEITQRV